MSNKFTEESEETKEMHAQSTVKKRKRRFGDRYDGYRVRKLDSFFYLIPHIMRERNDAQLFFEEEIPVERLEKFINQKRNQGENVRTVHIFLAALIRIIALRPQLNRFTIGKKIYSHNNIRFSMSIKRELTIEGEETTINPVFNRTDTLKDVCKTFEEALTQSRNENGEGENVTDGVVKVLRFLPTWLKNLVVFMLRNLDKVGLLPKLIYNASPFHSSAVVTDLGSLGIDSIYHHLYNFGTTSIFLAIGKKYTKLVMKPDGSIAQEKFIKLRFVLDERIVDGYYYASAIKLYKRFIKHPELLEIPPENLSDEL